MEATGIEMVWECPRCGVQLAQMEGQSLHLPHCSWFHERVEMEQRLASRWGVEPDDGA